MIRPASTLDNIQQIYSLHSQQWELSELVLVCVFERLWGGLFRMIFLQMINGK